MSSQLCCWCGTTQLFATLDEEHAVSEEETNVELLLELFGISSRILDENRVYRMCNDCAELVSYGTDLKMQAELEEDQDHFSEQGSRSQFEQVEKDLKCRAQHLTSIPATKNNCVPVLGFLLSKCFLQCYIKLRPEDVVSRAQGQDELDLTSGTNKVEINCASPVEEELDNCVKSEVSSDPEEPEVEVSPVKRLSRNLARSLKSVTEVTAKDKVLPLLESPEREVKFELVKMESDEESAASGSVPSHLQSTSAMKQAVAQSTENVDTPVPKKFECCGCSKVFNNEKERHIHEKKHIVVCDGKDYYKCDECGRVVLTSYHLRTHWRSHKQDSIACEICGKMLMNANSYQKHRRIKHNLWVRFGCKFCNKKYRTRMNVKIHETTCFKQFEGTSGTSTPTPFDEPQLPNGETEETLASANADIIVIDEKQQQDCERLECGLCSKAFDTVTARLDHEKSHVSSKNGKTVYMCDICGKEVSSYHNMRVHCRAHPNSLVCRICDKTFASKITLRHHMNIHDPKKPFHCATCDSQFTTNGQLVIHRRIHTGEKPYDCGYCGKSFARSDKLNRHRRSHTGEKPYVCKYCNVRFARGDKLQLHVRRHTGEKPYVCDICGESFIQSRYLATHKKRHEDEKAGSPKKNRRGRKPKLLLPQTSWSDEDISEGEQEEEDQASNEVPSEVTNGGLKMTLRRRKPKRVFTESDEDRSDAEDPPYEVPSADLDRDASS